MDISQSCADFENLGSWAAKNLVAMEITQAATGQCRWGIVCNEDRGGWMQSLLIQQTTEQANQNSREAKCLRDTQVVGQGGMGHQGGQRGGTILTRRAQKCMQ